MKQKKPDEITKQNLTTLRAFVNALSKLADQNPIVKNAIRKNSFTAAKNALYKK